MNDNPTTGQEWTVEWIAMLANKGREDEILASHNASLAASKELAKWQEGTIATYTESTRKLVESNKQLREQLAAERDAWDALTKVRPYLHPGPIPGYLVKEIDAALAQVKEGNEVEIYYDNRKGKDIE